MRTWIAWTLSLLAALGIGWYLGGTFGLPGPFIGTPEAAAEELRSVLRESDPLTRASRMERLFAKLDTESLPGAVDVYREEARGGEVIGAMRFMGRWAELDRVGMVEALRDWPDEQSQAQGYGWAVYQVALTEGVPAAVRFYSQIPPKLLFTARYWLVEGAVNAGDLTALYEWGASQPEGDDRKRIVRTTLTRLLRDGRQTAIDWFEGIPENAENHFKQLAFGMLLERLVKLDKDFALEYWATREGRPWAARTAIPMAVAWTDDDPEAAVAWVLSQPDGEERDRLLYAVIDRWSLEDDVAAVRWLETRSPRPELDRMYGRFTRSFTVRTPELAARLAGRISKPEARRDALTTFARYWFRRRPDELRGWLAASGVPAAETEEIVAALEAKRRRVLESKAAADG